MKLTILIGMMINQIKNKKNKVNKKILVIIIVKLVMIFQKMKILKKMYQFNYML